MQVIADELRFTWDGYAIAVGVSNIREQHGELYADIVVSADRESRALLHSSKLNLSANQSRTSVSKSLADRESTMPWPAILEQVCFLAREHYSRGEPPIDMREYAPRRGGRWLLRPYLERDGFTIMYAEGGTGKSIVALALATTIASGHTLAGTLEDEPGPTLYLDWETGPDTFHRRLRALCAPDFVDTPPVYYQHMFAPLVQTATNVRRFVAERGIKAVFIDSLGAAGDGPVEDSQTAVPTCRAIRALGVPVLAVHHKPKTTVGYKGAMAMFGSVYYVNYCRLAWELTGVAEEGSERISLAFVNTKANEGMLEPRHAMSLEFHNDAQGMPVRIDLAPESIRDHPELPQTIGDRIYLALRDGPMSGRELAEELPDISPASIRKTASRLIESNKVRKLSDGRLALAARA